MAMKSFLLFVSLSSLLAATAAPPPEPADQSAALPDVVVTATAAESLTAPSVATATERLNQIPGGASVVDAETYKRGRATTLKDALDFAPGVFIQPRFG